MCASVFLCVRSGPVNQLIANSSKTVKATDFKFDKRVPRDSPDMTPLPKRFFSKRGRTQGHVTLIFSALNANSSKHVKATDFKFDVLVFRYNPDMIPYFWKRERL